MFKKIGIFLLVAVLIAGVFGYSKYQDIYAPNVSENISPTQLYLNKNIDYTGLKEMLVSQSIVKDIESFDWVASLMKFDQNKIRSGKFQIEPGWSNRKLIQHLRSGKQTPVKIVLNNERLLSEVAGKIAPLIEPDSTSIMMTMLDANTLAKYNLNRENLMTLFIPNTYEVYWNITPEEFLDRMKKESDKFWNAKDRKAKLEELKMSKEEVYTLASIVEKETNYKPERPTVAAVYLNRIRKGIMLQADPTVVFANQDFEIRRVLNKHLEIDSPYNTYKYAGLPPGPIAMSSISSIDAVLQNEAHKYYYFCAKADNSGQHAFAKTLSQHNANAKKFQRWLNKQRIFK